MKQSHIVWFFTALIALCFMAIMPIGDESPQVSLNSAQSSNKEVYTAKEQLSTLTVKGRAQKTGYMRSQFGDGWMSINGCDMRNKILARDLNEITVNERCQVLSGILEDPYTGARIVFSRGSATSSAVQIDHVVALSNAWQTGAQSLSQSKREQFANDPLGLIAVDGRSNQQKSDGDAATWLPKNKSFRCTYVSRQIMVKSKYGLWVTRAEKVAMEQVLNSC
jgi:hypothetical protein